MSDLEPKDNLFPTMGDIASRTDALPEPEDDDARLRDDAPARIEQEDGEVREMQEVESLCMRCHKQVRVVRRPSSEYLWLMSYGRELLDCCSPPYHTSKKSSSHPFAVITVVIAIRKYKAPERYSVS